jgi:serine/threonine protein kinase
VFGKTPQTPESVKRLEQALKTRIVDLWSKDSNLPFVEGLKNIPGLIHLQKEAQLRKLHQNFHSSLLELKSIATLAPQSKGLLTKYDQYLKEATTTPTTKTIDRLNALIQKDKEIVTQQRTAIQQDVKHAKEWLQTFNDILTKVDILLPKDAKLIKIKNLIEKFEKASSLEEALQIDEEYQTICLTLGIAYEELSQLIADKALATAPKTAFGLKSVATQVETFVKTHLKKAVFQLLQTNKHSKLILNDPKNQKRRLGVIKCRYVPETEKHSKIEIVTKAFLGAGGCKVVETLTYLAGQIFKQIGTQTQAYAKWKKASPTTKKSFDKECRIMQLLKNPITIITASGKSVTIPPLQADAHILTGRLITKRKDPSTIKGILMPLCNKGDFFHAQPVFTEEGCTAEQVQEAFQDGIDGALGLASLHKRNLVHRDVKQGNFFRNSDELGRTKGFLADLGSVASTSDWQAVGGTVMYLAPEVIEHVGKSEYFYPKPSMDMWAYGYVLAERFFGRKCNPMYAHMNTTLKEITSDPIKHANDWRKNREQLMQLLLEKATSPQKKRLVTLIRHLLSLDPSQRPSAQSIAEELSSIRKEI